MEYKVYLKKDDNDIINVLKRLRNFHQVIIDDARVVRKLGKRLYTLRDNGVLSIGYDSKRRKSIVVLNRYTKLEFDKNFIKFIW